MRRLGIQNLPLRWNPVQNHHRMTMDLFWMGNPVNLYSNFWLTCGDEQDIFFVVTKGDPVGGKASCGKRALVAV